MLRKNQRSSRPQMGTKSNGARAAIATQNSSTVYSGKTENKLWFQASGTW